MTLTRPLQLILTLTLAIGLVACGQDDNPESVLAHVPAGTPFVIANLEPWPADKVNAMLAHSSAQLPAQVARMRELADELAEDNPELAGLMDAIATELDHKNWQAVFKDAGVDAGGHTALYGLGLSPVLRMQLSDPARFEVFVERVTKPVADAIAQATLGGVAYRYLDLPDIGLRLVLAQHDKQMIVAVLPPDSQPQLRLALGLDMPTNGSARERLQALAADQHFVSDSMIGYLDTSALLAQITSGKDPMVAAITTAALVESSNPEKLRSGLAALSSPDCMADMARIAARLPRITTGYRKFDTSGMHQRTVVHLAGDITAAFADVRSPFPLASGPAPARFTQTFPLPQLRDFWLAQARAVKDTPFVCAGLAPLNEAFAEIGAKARLLAMPPWGNLRGFHAELHDFSLAAGDALEPHFVGGIAMAMKNPQGMLAMAQTMVAPLNALQLQPDGKAVALPTKLESFIHDPAWAAMNDKAMAISIGPDKSLAENLLDTTSGGPAGLLMALHIDGRKMASWMRMAANRIRQTLPDAADSAESVEISARSYEQIKSMDMSLKITDAGLVLDSRMTLLDD